jgi:hypothetical protein
MQIDSSEHIGKAVFSIRVNWDPGSNSDARSAQTGNTTPELFRPKEKGQWTPTKAVFPNPLQTGFPIKCQRLNFWAVEAGCAFR